MTCISGGGRSNNELLRKSGGDDLFKDGYLNLLKNWTLTIL